MHETAYYCWTEMETLVCLDNFTSQVSIKQTLSLTITDLRDQNKYQGPGNISNKSQNQSTKQIFLFALQYTV